MALVLWNGELLDHLDYYLAAKSAARLPELRFARIVVLLFQLLLLLLQRNNSGFKFIQLEGISFGIGISISNGGGCGGRLSLLFYG